MLKAEHIRAHQVQPGDSIVHPWSGTRYTVEKVSTENGVVTILYKPNHRGTLGVKVRERRIMTRLRELV